MSLFKGKQKGSDSESVKTEVSNSVQHSVFRDAFKTSLEGRAPTDEIGQQTAAALGLFGGGGDADGAFELFDIPSEFTDLSELRSLMVKSDIPAEQVMPISFLLQLGEMFHSKVIPGLIGNYLAARIAKNRLGRKEYITAKQRTVNIRDDEDD